MLVVLQRALGRRLVMVLLAAAALGACGKTDGSAPASGSGSSTASATGSGPAPGSGGSAVAAAAGSPAAAAPGSADPAGPAGLSAKIKAARCGEPCLFLVDTPFDKLLDTYKAACAGMETKELGFDDCRKLDVNRNCIYAAHGLVYKKKRWRSLFAGKPWYEPRPDFDAKSISDLERANVHELKQRGQACKKGLHVSGADFERLKAWFAVLPKTPPMPKFVFTDQGKASPAALLKELGFAGYDRKKRKKFALTGTAGYAKFDELDDAVGPAFAAALPADRSKLRLISYEQGEVTVDEELGSDSSKVAWLWFVYDDHDRLVGLAASHMASD